MNGELIWIHAYKLAQIRLSTWSLRCLCLFCFSSCYAVDPLTQTVQSFRRLYKRRLHGLREPRFALPNRQCHEREPDVLSQSVNDPNQHNAAQQTHQVDRVWNVEMYSLI